jgi:DNA-binding SARP family transcriptional activator
MSDLDVEVRFHILGSLELHVGHREIAVTGRERVLLATLLCYADTVVDVERLVDAIWGDLPPRDARNQVQSCVSRLRKRLTTTGVREQIIITEPAGYRIKVDADQLDLRRFRQVVGEARAASSQARHEEAAVCYRTALAMWRGPALAGVDSDHLRKTATALDEEHLRVVEERLDVEFMLGAGGELIAELTDLVAKHRYRERLHGALMLALHRAGRHAEALAVYKRAREMLVDEVGTEPGVALRDMHQRILNDDPGLMVRAPDGMEPPAPRHNAVKIGSFAEVSAVCRAVWRSGCGYGSGSWRHRVSLMWRTARVVG